MDYVVGGVAALISGNVTPNRPRPLRKALTPVKNQQSPNVTPKSEFVGDRSVLLSPTIQKKKDIIKKSPKRIFDSSNLDVTRNSDSSPSSPKADAVKKDLQADLKYDSGKMGKSKKVKSLNSSLAEDSKTEGMKNKISSVNIENTVAESVSPKKGKNKKKKRASSVTDSNIQDLKNASSTDVTAETETKTSKKNKKIKDSFNVTETNSPEVTKNETNKASHLLGVTNKVTKQQAKKSLDSSLLTNNKSITNGEYSENNGKGVKNKRKRKLQEADVSATEVQLNNNSNADNIKKESMKQKNKGKSQSDMTEVTEENNTASAETNDAASPKKRRKRNKKKGKQNKIEGENVTETNDKGGIQQNVESLKNKKKNKKNKEQIIVNPNAITDKDSDSEHDSDDEIVDEDDGLKELVNNDGVSSDDENDEKKTEIDPVEQTKRIEMIEEENARTIFVGNVPNHNKIKSKLKKLFSQYGEVESVRIRGVNKMNYKNKKEDEVKPKQKDTNIVFAFVKFKHISSLEKAVAANGIVYNNCHLRVTRSADSGVVHDIRKSIFVGNLPFVLEDEELRRIFEKCGTISSVRIIRDSKTKIGKGFGYVNFDSVDGVELALRLPEEKMMIKKKVLRVMRSIPSSREQKPTTPRQQTGALRRIKKKRQNQDDAEGGPPQKQMRGANGQAWKNRQTKQQGGGDTSANKLQNNQPGAPQEQNQNTKGPRNPKKQRKEFVGMTAEKKKKKKMNKGEKKRKAISEILTK